MRRIATFLVASALSASCTSAHGVGAAVSVGKGLSNLTAYRLALLWDLGPWWNEEKRYHFHGYWEGSVAAWHASQGVFQGSREDASVFTTGPQVRWQRSTPNRHGHVPYIEGGIGASWISKKEIGGRRLSMHFQFEDRIGLGMFLADDLTWDVNVRFIHYSNASLGNNNSGMNVTLLTVGRWF